MTDIVERLRDVELKLNKSTLRHMETIDDAIIEIEHLRSRIEDLETALRIEHRNHPELP